jgi:hypothetical protein
MVERVVFDPVRDMRHMEEGQPVKVPLFPARRLFLPSNQMTLEEEENDDNDRMGNAMVHDFPHSLRFPAIQNCQLLKLVFDYSDDDDDGLYTDYSPLSQNTRGCLRTYYSSS